MAQRREDLRVADVDRAFVAERLKAAVDEGRLTLSEYDERLRDTYAAKTYGDLDRLIGDLPHVRPPEAGQLAEVRPPEGHQGGGETPSHPPTAGTTGHRSIPRWLAAVWGAWIVAVSVNVVIWLLVSLSAQDPVYFWPMWVAGPWGALLLATTFTGLLGGAPYRGDDRQYRKAERQAERYRARAEQRAERYRARTERWAARRGYRL